MSGILRRSRDDYCGYRADQRQRKLDGGLSFLSQERQSWAQCWKAGLSMSSPKRLPRESPARKMKTQDRCSRNSAICEVMGKEEAIRGLGKEDEVVLTMQTEAKSLGISWPFSG